MMAPLLFKLIVHLVTSDSKITSKTPCKNLNLLDTFAAKVAYDVDKIHLYFYSSYNQLVRRGETIDDPVSILFDLNLSLPDANMRDYMKKKQNDWSEDKDYIKNITYDGLIALATNKYNTLKASGHGGIETPYEKKIIAMATKLQDLKSKLKISKTIHQREVTKLKRNKREVSPTRVDMVKREESPRKTNKHKRLQKAECWHVAFFLSPLDEDCKRQNEEEALKKIVSKHGEPIMKTMNGKDYNWCIHHMAWCIRTSAKCHLKNKQASASTLPSAPETTINHEHQAKMAQIQTCQAAIDWFMAHED